MEEEDDEKGERGGLGVACLLQAVLGIACLLQGEP